LLVHGLGAGWRSWTPIIEELAERREVIAVDLPGFGETPPLTGEVSIATLTDSVADFIGEQGLDGVATVGQSMGGRMVLELARRGMGGDTVALDPGGFWSDRELFVFAATRRPAPVNRTARVATNSAVRRHLTRRDLRSQTTPARRSDFRRVVARTLANHRHGVRQMIPHRSAGAQATGRSYSRRMVFASPVSRQMPNRLADERHALTQQLDYHRATLLRKLEGLDDEALRQQMTASGLSLLGLVKHLTETERGWFLEIFAGAAEGKLQPTDADPDSDFRVHPEEGAEVLARRYLIVCDQAREVVADAELDRVVTTPWGAKVNLRAIMLHMVQETARHNGHADIIRESIDGEVGQ